jgi:hypothetical protein
MKLHFQYRKTWWWHFIHYNYFHKRLFKEFYRRKVKFSASQVKKYHLFQKIDDIITLRKWDWLRNIIWQLDWKIKS